MSEPTPATPPGKPAHAFAATRDWPGYFDAVAGKGPRETLLLALQHFGSFVGEAVDLGCGEGRDTAELLRRGWRVWAIDGHPDALRRLAARGDLVGRERLEARLATFERVEIPACDLLNSSFSLPFCSPGSFAGLWERIEAAIRPGGRFAGQFFGDKDSWATLKDRSHQTRGEIERLLARFEVERLQEEDKPGNDAEGFPKHWHVFHVVARRR